MSRKKNKSEDNLEDVTTDESDETLIPLHQDDTLLPVTTTGTEKAVVGPEVQADDSVALQPDVGTDSPETLRQMLDEQKRTAEHYHDSMLRAQAELENMRKRAVRDIENAHKYALERFITDLLPVVDSLEMGISASGNAGGMESVLEGMNLTYRMVITALEKFGVQAINPQGGKFNPELHEAVSMQETDGAESGTVIAVMQKGYELNGRLVRPAMVVVAK